MSNNPFPVQDKDHHYLWEMLVERDIKAFINKDWEIVKNDFKEEGFLGTDAGKSNDIDRWKLAFPTLESYKKSWLKQADAFAEIDFIEDLSDALHRVTVLQDIEIVGDTAMVHKKFFGAINRSNGEVLDTDWQTLYYCKKIEGTWKITGFNGYMPVFSGKVNKRTTSAIVKRQPENSGQHETAGPYAPVLVVDPGKLIVISGQAAIDKKGNVIGDTIEEQTAYTLDNCSVQLASASCTLDDVFKVNVYITDLDQWPRFNDVYKNYFKDPKPVRTAVQTGLLMNLLVEVEMWAVKK